MIVFVALSICLKCDHDTLILRTRVSHYKKHLGKSSSLVKKKKLPSPKKQNKNKNQPIYTPRSCKLLINVLVPTIALQSTTSAILTSRLQSRLFFHRARRRTRRHTRKEMSKLNLLITTMTGDRFVASSLAKSNHTNRRKPETRRARGLST